MNLFETNFPLPFKKYFEPRANSIKCPFCKNNISCKEDPALISVYFQCCNLGLNYFNDSEGKDYVAYFNEDSNFRLYLNDSTFGPYEGKSEKIDLSTIILWEAFLIKMDLFKFLQ